MAVDDRALSGPTVNPEAADPAPQGRSRRSLLAGIVGVVAGLSFGRLAQAPGASAATGDPVLAGNANTANTETSLTSSDANYDDAGLIVSGGTGRSVAGVNTATNPIGIGGNAVVGTSSVGIGVVGTGGRAGVVGSASSGPGVWGSSAGNAEGVLGEAFGLGSGPAVFGHATNTGDGVIGASASGAGVKGTSASGVGLAAQSTGGNLASQAFTGVGTPPTPAPINFAVPTASYGEANGTNGTGVWGYSGASTGTGVYGESSIGVWGFGGWGVFGASSAAGTGVYGFSGGSVPAAPAHTGVFGYSDSGTGVYAKALTGTALYVNGKAKFSRSGIISISAGHRQYTKALAGVTTGSIVIAVVQRLVTGVYLQAVVPVTGKFTIYLNKNTTTTTRVAYFVIN